MVLVQATGYRLRAGRATGQPDARSRSLEAWSLKWTAPLIPPPNDAIGCAGQSAIALPLAGLAAVLVLLPGWIRPSVSRSRIRTAIVTAGPIESVITASGTVAPEIERVLSSPLDARVLRVLKRPGTSVEAGRTGGRARREPVGAVAREGREGCAAQRQSAGADAPDARTVAARAGRTDRAEDARPGIADVALGEPAPAVR